MTAAAFNIGTFTIYWYGLAYLIGFAFIYLQAERTLGRDDTIPFPRPLVLPLVVTVGVFAFVGAKAPSLIAAWGNSGVVPSWRTGMSSFGAVIGVGIGAWLFARIVGTSVLISLDLVAPAAFLGVFLVRCANYLNGDIPGAYSDALGGAHPVALYEAILEGLLPLGLMTLWGSKSLISARPGRLSVQALTLYLVARLACDGARETSYSSATVLSCIGLLAFASCWLVREYLRPRKYLRVSSAHQFAIKHDMRVSRTSALKNGVWVGILPAIYIPLIGCGSAPPKDIPNFGETDPVKIERSNPNGDPTNCPCANSSGVYAANYSASTRNWSWIVYAKDNSSGEDLKPEYGNKNIPGSNGGQPGKIFLGCTKYAPATSCRFDALYEKRLSIAAYTPKNASAAIFGQPNTPSITTCKAWCSNPDAPDSGPCLPLQSRFYSTVAPLSKLVSDAEAGGASKIDKKDILVAYNKAEADDKCGRGDITRSGDKLINVGSGAVGDYCRTVSEELDPPTVTTLNKRGYKVTAPMKMFGFIPYRVEATTAPAVRGLTESKVVLFEEQQYAPLFTFDGINGDLLTRDFGGQTLAATRVVASVGKTRLVIATSNGCMSVEEP